MERRIGLLYHQAMRHVLVIAVLLLPFVGFADDYLHGADGLPAYVLQIPESIESILIAETDSSTLYRYSLAAGGLRDHEARYMSVGQNGVGKQRSGDRRTPLGIYFITEQLDTSRLHEKYGPIAFPLDYPNVWDVSKSKTGDGIWIHGVMPNGGRRPPLDTDGCIALPNADLLALQQHLQVMTTPVIITRKIVARTAAELTTNRDDLNAALAVWAESYRRGDWHRYQSMYSADFEYRGLDREEWLAYRVQSGKHRSVRELTVENVLLLADPEEPDLFLSRFRQTIVEDVGKFTTVKRLYWRRSDSG